MRPEGNFNVGLRNGLLDRKHYQAMRGDALWLYSWLVDRQTRRLDKNGLGKVAGGVPISDADIAGAYGCSEKTVSRWRGKLVRGKYIAARRTSYGYVYGIEHPKKWAADRTEVSDHSPLEIGQNCPPDRTELSTRSDTSVRNKEEIQRVTKRDIEPESVSPDFPPEMEKEIWGYYIQQIGKHPSITTLTPLRSQMGRKRFAEALVMTGGDPKKALILMKCAVDTMADSAWHSGKNDAKMPYNEWEHIFSTSEQFQRWLERSNHGK